MEPFPKPHKMTKTLEHRDRKKERNFVDLSCEKTKIRRLWL
jgi:hypothetical protein